MDQPFFETRTDLTRLSEAVEAIRSQMGTIIVGQHHMIDLMVAALLSDGHLLIEGVPGVAKTLSAKLMAHSLQIPFSRIQFTPDLMPGDVLGTSVFSPKDTDFHFRKGPIFAGVVLIDEINRAPAKTQSALFEVMEERQVTMDGTTYPMQEPFMVVATQNPIEQEGTYRLPEAQLDRFLFKIEVKYPSLDEEVLILEQQQYKSAANQMSTITPVLQAEDIRTYRALVRSLTVEPKLLRYIAAIVGETRNNTALYLGASPRASLNILQASKAIAGIRGRDFVVPEDVVYVAPHVLRHRIVLTAEKEMEGISPDEMIQRIIDKIEVPR